VKTELKTFRGGREIRWAIVQMLNISTQARQIFHSRKNDDSTIPVLLVQYDASW